MYHEIAELTRNVLNARDSLNNTMLSVHDAKKILVEHEAKLMDVVIHHDAREFLKLDYNALCLNANS